MCQFTGATAHVCSSSDGCSVAGFFGSDVGHMFQLSRIGHVVARLVLGQNFHQWMQL